MELISIRNTIWGEGIEIPMFINRRYAAETHYLNRKRGLKPTPMRGVVATRRDDPPSKCPNPRGEEGKFLCQDGFAKRMNPPRDPSAK